MSFRMRCPKCHSSNLDLEEDQRAFLGGGRHQVLLHCYTCGMILYGEERIQEEFERQRAEWEKQVNERQERAARARAARAARAAVRPRPKPRPKAATPAPGRTVAAPAKPPVQVASDPVPSGPSAEQSASPDSASAAGRGDDAQSPATTGPLPLPSTLKEPKDVSKARVATDGQICAWKNCEKVARPNSKYCSRNCSNKNARARHASRKKKKKVGGPDDTPSSTSA